MKKQIGVKLGVTFALLFSFLFSTPTPQYQVEAAKTKTEEKAKIKRTANKKITVKVKKYIDGDTTRFKLKNGKNITAKYLLIDTPELKKESPYAKEAKNRTKELLKSAKKFRSSTTRARSVIVKKENWFMFGQMANSYKKPLLMKAWGWYAVRKVKIRNIKTRSKKQSNKPRNENKIFGALKTTHKLIKGTIKQQ